MSLRILTIISLLLFCFSCSEDSKKVFYIADAKVDCTGVTPQKCLQIKEEGITEWTYFYSNIDGFDYEEGFFYKIKVRVTEVENPPADASSLKYTLIEILEKSKAPLTIDKGSWMVTRIKDMDNLSRNPFIQIDTSKEEISGNTGCNRFSGKIEVNNNKIAFTEVSSTKMMCKNIEIENAFLAALDNTKSYTLKGEKLQLLDEKQELLMECEYSKTN